MKKLIAVVAFAMVSVLTFAQNKFTVGLYGNVPIQTGKYDSEFYDDVEKTITSVGFGIDGHGMITNMFGVALDLGFYFPQSMKWEFTQGNKSETNTIKRKDVDGSWWGFDMIAGCAIAIVNDSTSFFTVSPGFHFNSQTMDELKYTSYGIGCKISYHYNLGEMFYVGAGCDLAYDFLCYEEFDGKREEAKKYTVFDIVPKIGFGVKF